MTIRSRALFAGLVALLSVSATAAADQDYQIARHQMSQAVEKVAVRNGVKRDRYLTAAIAALDAVPRERFVPADQQALAYADQPLPIGYQQTISDPYIVAVMTALLRVGKDDSVLEIGTGSGYQAAVLGLVAGHAWSIEIVEPLATQAAARLRELHYDNVTVRAGDGYAGWPEHAPFDAIIVTAGAPYVPPALIEQLKPGGRMVIPLGPNWAEEELVVIDKRKDGTIARRSLGRVFFVDFTGRIQQRSPR